MQTALCLRGRRIKINQFQHYSEELGRMVTKYVLVEERIGAKNVTILETYQMADVVKTLAALYGGGG